MRHSRRRFRAGMYAASCVCYFTLRILLFCHAPNWFGWVNVPVSNTFSAEWRVEKNSVFQNANTKSLLVFYPANALPVFVKLGKIKKTPRWHSFNLSIRKSARIRTEVVNSLTSDSPWLVAHHQLINELLKSRLMPCSTDTKIYKNSL